MSELKELEALSKNDLYRELALQAGGLLHDERDPIANAANLSSLLYHSLPAVNWVGFYFLRDEELLVGPFQGKPACVHIPLGKGACGTAASTRRIQRVRNVAEFPGHIPCDSASNSEIVLPVIADGKLLGVLDIDSPLIDRFDEDDEAGLAAMVEIYVRAITADGDLPR